MKIPLTNGCLAALVIVYVVLGTAILVPGFDHNPSGCVFFAATHGLVGLKEIQGTPPIVLGGPLKQVKSDSLRYESILAELLGSNMFEQLTPPLSAFVVGSVHG